MTARVQNIVLALGLCVLGACSKIPADAYLNRGTPESLLDASSERVAVSLYAPESTDELVQWLSVDQPTRIELGCVEGEARCMEVLDIAQQFAVPVEFSETAGDEVVLVYDRIRARDCNQRFVSNHINPYNLPHPTSGCALAANMLQMISDKQQIVAPSLMDYHDGEKLTKTAIEVYQNVGEFETRTKMEDIFEFKGGE